MSDGNWGKRDALVDQGIGVLAAIILCCLVVGFAAFALGRDAERDSKRAAEYEGYGDRRERAFCHDLGGFDFAKCQLEQEQTAREAYQSERDLNAQRDMSLWAFAVFVISAVTAGLTLWALWYVRGTLIATREALDDTGKATIVMGVSNDLARDVQLQSLRSFVGLSAFEMPKRRDQNWREIVLEFKNFGSIPSVQTSIATSYCMVEQGKYEKLSLELNRTSKLTILDEIHPGQAIRRVIPITLPITQEEWLVTTEGLIYFEVILFYKPDERRLQWKRTGLASVGTDILDGKIDYGWIMSRKPQSAEPHHP